MTNLKAKCPRCCFEYVIPLERELVRTIPQNKLYWGVYVRILADHFGYFLEEMHEELKYLFNPVDSKIKPGNRVGGSTARMTRKQFTEYLEKIELWADAEHGVLLPKPESDEK